LWSKFGEVGAAESGFHGGYVKFIFPGSEGEEFDTTPEGNEEYDDEEDEE